MGQLPSRSDFAARQRQYHSKVRRAGVKMVIGWVVAIAAGTAVILATVKDGEMQPWSFAGPVICVLVFFGGGYLHDRRAKTIANEAGLACPACKRTLVQLDGKLALTTGRCPYCGEVVAAEDHSAASLAATRT
jgi:hypothetical protein